MPPCARMIDIHCSRVELVMYALPYSAIRPAASHSWEPPTLQIYLIQIAGVLDDQSRE